MLNNVKRKNRKPKKWAFREIGILVFAYTTGVPISAERFQEIGMEGREAIYTALRNLRNMGYLEIKLQHFNGRIVKANSLTTKGINFMTTLGIYELTANPILVKDVFVSKNVPHNMVSDGQAA